MRKEAKQKQEKQSEQQDWVEEERKMLRENVGGS